MIEQQIRGLPPIFKMINRKRLTKLFLEIAKIESPSGKERLAASFVKRELKRLGLNPIEDRFGNILIRVRGQGVPLLIGAHLDTVEPCQGIKPKLVKGKFSSSGKTILGADNKAVVAAIIEFLNMVKEDGLKIRPLEVIFTVREELGSAGASKFNFRKIKSKHGIIFDRDGAFGTVTSGAPYYYTIDIEVNGRSAHAGFNPEDGISAVSIAAAAISKLRLGRIDKETTANIGTICGGSSRNTIPGKVVLQAEVRSLNKRKALTLVGRISREFEGAANKLGGKAKFEIKNPAQGFKIRQGKFVRETLKVLKRLKFDPSFKPTCGGSDANIFNGKGIETLNLTYGAYDVHTIKESIALKDMENVVRVITEIATKKRTG